FDTVKTRLQCSPPGTYKGAIDCLVRTVRNEGAAHGAQGVTPPAVGWAAIDSVLLGSLHNYRLWMMRVGMVESAPGPASGDGKRLSLVGHGVAGLFAGLTRCADSSPWTVRLQMQLQRDVASRQFKGPLHCAAQVMRAQGLQGLWRGYVASSWFRSSFFWMFLSIEALMRGFARLDGTPYEMSQGAANFWAGGLASFSFWGFAIPADNIKNRLMGMPLDTPRIAPWTLSRQVWRAEGARGFYKGFVPCVLRAFPANACAYFTFNWIMTTLGAEDVRGQ
ncbi:mitochondrial carrier, partial [Auricularia subglabra TFB-10046 SS5]